MAKAAQLNLAEGWTAVAVRPDQAAESGAGPSEERAAKQPDPPAGRGSPK